MEWLYKYRWSDYLVRKLFFFFSFLFRIYLFHSSHFECWESTGSKLPRRRTIAGHNENGGKWWAFWSLIFLTTRIFQTVVASLMRELICVVFVLVPPVMAAENDDSLGKRKKSLELGTFADCRSRYTLVLSVCQTWIHTTLLITKLLRLCWFNLSFFLFLVLK